MRNASTALKNYLFSATTSELLVADLYTITFADGITTRLTTWEHNLTVGGNPFFSTTALVAPTKKTIKCGVEVSMIELQIIGGSLTINGLAVAPAALVGAFDMATVLWERLVMPTDGDVSLGTTIEFSGVVSNVKPITNGVTMTVVSDLYILQQKQVPKRVFQSGCPYDLFDTGCTLNATSFRVAGVTVASGSTQQKLVTSLAQAAGYFDEGVVQFSSGANAGRKETVRLFASGVVYLVVAMPYAVSIGDTFNIWPGCDKTSATCNTKFSNLVNFGGQEFIPIPEKAL